MKSNTKHWWHLAALGIALGLAAGPLQAAPPQGLNYTFEIIQTVGDPAPGGGTFQNDFEPYGLNNRGDVLFASDLGPDILTTGESIYLWSKGNVAEIVHPFTPAPGGGLFDFTFFGPMVLNDQDDAALTLMLSSTPRLGFYDWAPVLQIPGRSNLYSGAYRYSHAAHALSKVVAPGDPVPGGGEFQGVFFGPSLNNGGKIAFSGIVPTAHGVHNPDQTYAGLGLGVFLADRGNNISPVAAPGDSAPGGGTFDEAIAPWVNDAGDVSFTGHVAGEECKLYFYNSLVCLGSVYVRKAATGTIQSIAHLGDPAPGGGVFRQAYFQVMNNRGDIAFLGDLTPAPDSNQQYGIFLYSGGEIIPIVRPGYSMPGGGKFVNAIILGTNLHINNPGEVVFNAQLDTLDKDGQPVVGLYVWSAGSLRLVTKTGNAIPGIGATVSLFNTPGVAPSPANNDEGQVSFSVTLEDGRVVMLVATPH